MAYVQGATGGTRTSVVAVAFTSNNTAGNTLFAICQALEPFSGYETLSITDTAGNTWTPFSGPPSEYGSSLSGVWICESCLGGANTVSFTYGHSGESFWGSVTIAGGVVEWAGLGTLEAHAATSNSGATSVTASITTTESADTLIGVCISYSEGVTGEQNSSGWNSDLSAGIFPGAGYAMSVGVFDETAGAAGSYSLAVQATPSTIGAGQYVYLLAFKAAEAQTITFAPIPAHAVGDGPFTLAPASDSGLTVSLAVTSGPATVSGDTVTLTGAAGTVTIEATQAGNGTYAAATPVYRSFIVYAQRGNIAYNQIRASDRTGNGNQLLTYSPAPASATSLGTPGQVAFDAEGNWYWCYGANQWARIGPTGYGSAAASPPSW